MKEKIKPTLVHLVISLVAAIAILALLFLYWFPPPLMGLGAVQGVQLILIVDLVIGPLCTFVVYKKGKKGMAIDLTVIGVLQIAALAYGLWAVNSQRPSYLVLTYTGLEVVSHYDEQLFLSENNGMTQEGLKSSSLKYQGLIPVLQLVEPSDAYTRGGSRIEFEFNKGMPYYFDVDNYNPLTNLSGVPAMGTGKFAFQNGCYLLPIMSPHGSSEVCLNEKQGTLVSM